MMKNFNKFLPSFLLFLIIIISCWYLYSQAMFRTHDYIHGARIAQMQTMIADGQIPPRWSSAFGFGYGMPLFQFYAPLPYMFGALIYSLSSDLVLASKSLFLMATVFTTIGSYKLGLILFKKTDAALLLSLLATLTPYRALNLTVRGAVSEAWAGAFLYLIVYYVIKIWKKNEGFLGLVLSLTGLFLSHNLTVFMSFFLFAILGIGLLMHSLVEKKLIQPVLKLKKMIFAGISAVLLSAFYLFPAFLEKDYTQLESATVGGYFDFRLHFLYLRQFLRENWGWGGSEWGPDDGISFFIGYPQIIGLALSFYFICLFLVKFFYHKYKLKLDFSLLMTLTLGLSALFALFMSLTKSQFIWEQISIFSFLQFPWRWLNISSFAISVVAVYGYSQLKTGLVQKIFLIVLIISSAYQLKFFQPETYLVDNQSLYYSDPERIAKHMSTILIDYFPQTADYSSLWQKVPTALFECPMNNEDCVSRVLKLSSSERMAEIKLNDDTEVIINQLDYPGWIIEVDGIKHPHSHLDDGRMFIFLEKGEYVVSARLARTKVRLYSDLATLLGFIIVLSVYILDDHKMKTTSFRKIRTASSRKIKTESFIKIKS